MTIKADTKLTVLSQALRPEQMAINKNNARLLPRIVKTTLWSVLGLFLALVAFIFVTNVLWDGLEVGPQAPDFSAQDIHGSQIQLSQYTGQPVMLTFWSPDCSACIDELPALQSIGVSSEGNSNLITVVGGYTNEEIQVFMAEHQLTFPVSADENADILSLYNVHGIPFTYLISPSGLIEKRVIGGGKPEELEHEFALWLQTCSPTKGCQ